MTTTVVYGDASDGYIGGTNATYATARQVATSTLDTATEVWVGQATGFTCYEGFLAFDTSGTGSNPITSATLELLDHLAPTGSFTIECRLYDWGTTLTLGDWVPGASISQTLLATFAATAGNWTGAVYHTFTDVAMAANINRSGFTRFLLNSDLHRIGTQPTTSDLAPCKSAETAGTTSDPKLTIVTADPAATLSGTATSGMTESDVVAGGKVLTITLANATWIP